MSSTRSETEPVRIGRRLVRLRVGHAARRRGQIGVRLRRLAALAGQDDGVPAPAPAAQSEPDLRPQEQPPAGKRLALLDLQAGDRVSLPIGTSDHDVVCWSAPVTISSVLLIDTELAQVRWLPEGATAARSAYALLTGAAFRAGAVLVPEAGSRPSA